MKTRFDWTTGPLAEGLHCYRTQQFFAAHEHWEGVWLSLREPEKSFLQALIQITAAFHHLQSDNPRGAISLLGRALRRLECSAPECCCLNAALLRNQARDWLSALQNEGSQLPAAYPAFQLLDTGGSSQNLTEP
jgi:hypothetical protein